MTPTLGQLVRSFFADHLAVQKGLRPGSIRSYRDTMRLFLCFLTEHTHLPIARLSLQDLTARFERRNRSPAEIPRKRTNMGSPWRSASLVKACL